MTTTNPHGPGNYTEGGGSPLESIDHVAVVVESADTAIAEYFRQLGLKPIHDESLEHLNVRLVYLDAGNSMLQLVEPTGPGPIADFLSEQGEGLHHVCFVVDDVRAATSLIPGLSTAAVFRGGRDRLACFLTTEPHGLRVELTDRNARSAEELHGD